jgi:Copper type II ascorbate-dependent monooxygenase, C-terminal domain
MAWALRLRLPLPTDRAMRVRLRPWVLSALAAAACTSRSPQEPASASPEDLNLTFAYDAPAGGEQYECFGFDASPLAGRWLTSIDWTTPSTVTGAALHHAALYAYPQDYPDGPVPCESMPVAWTMHVWVPGGTPLTLPRGVAIALPAATRRFVVQAHVLRIAGGPSGVAKATLHVTDTPPEHIATWLPAAGSVPAIRPYMTEHSSTTCVVATAMHVISSTPHMHLIGTSFQGVFVRGDGTRTVVVDVPTWNFDEQKTYAIGQDLAPGDAVETDCTWTNPTDNYVLPGGSTKDEMCAQALIAWPAQTAAWTTGPCL